MSNGNETAVDHALAELDVELSALIADKDASAIMSLSEWYLKQIAELNAARKQIMEHGKLLLAQVASRERALQYHFGADFKTEIDQQLAAQPSKKKSIDTHFGRAGYRKIPGRVKVVVEDERQALVALEQSCPTAIKRTISQSALSEYVKVTGEEIPGVRVEEVEARESFYPNVTELLPEGSDDD